MILVSAMHITAGVWVNDAEDGLLADIDEWLEKLAPFRQDYRHHRTGETNGDSHLKSLLVHHEVIVPVTGGKLDFGPWQQVYYAEFDGQRGQTRHHQSNGRVSLKGNRGRRHFHSGGDYETHDRLPDSGRGAWPRRGAAGPAGGAVQARRGVLRALRARWGPANRRGSISTPPR